MNLKKRCSSYANFRELVHVVTTITLKKRRRILHNIAEDHVIGTVMGKVSKQYPNLSLHILRFHYTNAA